MILEDLLLFFMQAVYIVSLFGLAIYGLNNLVTTVLFLRTRIPHKRPELPADHETWPFVTIQLPVFNERFTVERLLSAISRLDYPRSRLEVQVLDDSTDDTTLLIRRLVDQIKSTGLSIEMLHRVDRIGFKAGAMNEGLKKAHGDLIAVFDADFVPPANWLIKAVPEFQSPNVGCLQTRWGHLNSASSTFTRAQALGIDGHFVIEQTARSYNNLFMNFNGTAGIWRRTCIEDAGGWQSDTLTEDLDLSYRAQMRGWHIGYLPDVVVPAELPAQIEAFKVQQFRWAKGSFQTVKKLFPQIVKTNVPLKVRWMALVHITGYFVHPLMLITLIMLLPIGLFAPHTLKMFPWTTIAGFGPPFMYMVTRSETAPRLWDRVKLLPFLVLMGFGLSLNNSIAVFEGLFGKKRGTFVRTPKYSLTNEKSRIEKSFYSITISPMIWGEIFLIAYSLLTIFVLTPVIGWETIPCVLIYTAGYGYMVLMNLWQSIEVKQPHPIAAHL